MRNLIIAVFIGVIALLGVVSSDSQAKVFDPKTFTLDNGLQVVVISNHRAPIVTQMLWYKVGSADEPRGKSGLAHYLEHLMFKATKTLKSGEFSRIVARNGGRDNAFTSYDYTGYHQSVAVDRLETIMRLEADRMRNIIFDPAEIEPERQVVLEERRSRTDNSPGARLSEQVNAAMYLNYPYRDPIIGWAHEIKGLSVTDLKEFYDRWYAPNNAILVLAGDVTVEQVRPLAEKYYGPIPRGPEIRRDRTIEPPHNAARRVILRDPRVRQPSLRVSYMTASRNYGETQHAYPLEVLSEILGGNTGRLYKALVIDQKIAVSAGAFYDPDGIGPGGFTFFATPAEGVEMDKLEAALLAELSRVTENGVTEDEIARAKARMSASAIYARDSAGRGARVIGAALSTGQTIEDVEAWPERIDAVTKAQIDAAAGAAFVEKNSVTGLLLSKRAS